MRYRIEAIWPKRNNMKNERMTFWRTRREINELEEYFKKAEEYRVSISERRKERREGRIRSNPKKAGNELNKRDFVQ